MLVLHLADLLEHLREDTILPLWRLSIVQASEELVARNGFGINNLWLDSVILVVIRFDTSLFLLLVELVERIHEDLPDGGLSRES